MKEAHHYLLDWSIQYIKHKDTVRREVESVDVDHDSMTATITYKDKTVAVLVFTTFADDVLKTLDKKKHYILVALNNRANLTYILDHWKALIEYENLKIYCCNPFSTQDHVWLIHPRTHHAICDPESLPVGIKSMAQMVDPITPEQFARELQDHHE